MIWNRGGLSKGGTTALYVSALFSYLSIFDWLFDWLICWYYYPQMPEEEAFAVLVKIMQEYKYRELFKPSMAELGLCMFQLECMIQVTDCLSSYLFSCMETVLKLTGFYCWVLETLCICSVEPHEFPSYQCCEIEELLSGVIMYCRANTLRHRWRARTAVNLGYMDAS